MKALLLNGSPHIDGCTATALKEVEKTLRLEGMETETINIGSLPIRGCIACGHCHKAGKCVFDDIVNETAKKFEEADALIVGSPVYFACPNGTLLNFLTRLFYSTRFEKRYKVGASVVSCRRGGAASTFDQLNKFFTICSMPIASSQYWNSVHGFTKEDVLKDLEGLQTMRTLGHNIAFLVKSIKLGEKEIGKPETEPIIHTSFPDGK